MVIVQVNFGTITRLPAADLIGAAAKQIPCEQTLTLLAGDNFPRTRPLLGYDDR